MTRRSPPSAGDRQRSSSPRRSAGKPARAPRPDPRPNVAGRPHRRPVAGHVRRTRPAGDAVAPIAVAGPDGHWLWFPQRVRLDAALLSVARDDPHRPVRHADRASATTTRPERSTTRNTLAGVVARRRLHDRVWSASTSTSTRWGGAPFVPPGWDRWFAKENADESTAYYDYEVVDQGIVRHYGDGALPTTPPTCSRASAPVRAATHPTTAPWFLYFAPNAPHPPWIPAPAPRRVRRRGAPDPDARRAR